jgi:cellulose synthase/poly-beta-1,6-N-acetylglucosamine synthase-like glycosyltransferase
MTLVRISFLGGATLLWVSVFGYLLFLRMLARRPARRGTARRETPVGDWPHVTVVIPTLNEERWIASKLADVALTDYPAERLRVVVVDGGSSDRTRALVAAHTGGTAVELMVLPRVTWKSEQITHALARIDDDLVVITDADARLAPSCIRELVGELLRDPRTAVVGASVQPDTPLLEERLHWWFLNCLWWLEGEALSAAIVSGVCYGVRRQAVADFPRDAPTEDVHLATAASARGFRVRICRTAHATELRAPRTLAELMRFRRRRGAAYVAELLRWSSTAAGPPGWRLAHGVRLWHFLVTPVIVVALAVCAALLLSTPFWWWPVLVAAAFIASVLAVAATSTTLADTCSGRPWHLGVAATRLLGMLWFAVVAIPRHRVSPLTPTGH